MTQEEMHAMDRRILTDLYLSRQGLGFVEELVERFGSRFGATPEERAAGDYIAQRLRDFGLDKVWKQEIALTGWTRGATGLTVLAPIHKTLDCIALPYCPPGRVEARLVYLGDGNPQVYEERREELRGAIVMVSTATPKFYHRTMHRMEKLGRALEAGAVGFIWMRGEPGGLPETGAARFGKACEIPAISVSNETGHQLLRLARQGEVVVEISSANQVSPSTAHNVIGELTGREKPEEIIVIGGHYDGHDISEAACDNGAGTAVAMEATRALAAAAKGQLARSVRVVAFTCEEIGMIGSENYMREHSHENIVMMINLDGAGRGSKGTFALQNWPESVSWFRRLFQSMHEEQVSTGDQVSLYSDMYHFAAHGFPAATYTSSDPVAGGAPRGYGHTYWDTVDKVNGRFVQSDAIIIARLVLRLATMDRIPLARKTPADFGKRLQEIGFDEVLRYEGRPVPGN